MELIAILEVCLATVSSQAIDVFLKFVFCVFVRVCMQCFFLFLIRLNLNISDKSIIVCVVQWLDEDKLLVFAQCTLHFRGWIH